MWTNDVRELLHGRLLAAHQQNKGPGMLNPRRGQSWETQVRGILHSKTKTEHGVAKARGSTCTNFTLLTSFSGFLAKAEWNK